MESDYYGHCRHDLIRLVDGHALQVLELGCGTGATGAEMLRSGIAKEVIGVEIDSAAFQIALRRLTFALNADASLIKTLLSGHQFDVILAGDVLEHLVDPLTVLKDLREFMKPNSQLVCSVPTIRSWRALLPLLFLGRFSYSSSGILDKTHLRFFTRRSLTALISEAGYEVEVVMPLFRGARLLRDFWGLRFAPEILVDGFRIRARLVK